MERSASTLEGRPLSRKGSPTAARVIVNQRATTDTVARLSKILPRGAGFGCVVEPGGGSQGQARPSLLLQRFRAGDDNNTTRMESSKKRPGGRGVRDAKVARYAALAAMVSQYCSKSPLRWRVLRSRIDCAPGSDQRIPDCLRRCWMIWLIADSTGPEPIGRLLAIAHL